MMQTTKCVAVLCAAVVLGRASEARAQLGQAWEGRGYATVSGGAQSNSRTFDQVSAPLIYGEAAAITVPHKIGSGGIVDLSAGVRVWSNLAIGLGYSHFGNSETPTLTAQIPNPLFFNSPRSASASAGKLSHSESAVHLQFVWVEKMSDKFEVAFVVGPSFFKVGQDFVGSVTPVEGTLPFSTVSIGSVQMKADSKWGTGGTGGLDVTYLVGPWWGAGFFARYSGAKATLDLPDGGTKVIHVGGFQVGGGLRLRF